MKHLVIFAFIAGLFVPGSALAQTGTESPTGQYTSPSYGYEISWDSSWTIEEESSEGGYDFLHISSDASDLYFEGFIDYGGDLDVCLDEETFRLQNEEGVFDVEVVDEGTVETGDGVVSGKTRTFTFTLDSDGVLENVTQHTDCRSLSGPAILVITHYALTEVYEVEADRVRSITSTIVLPDQLATSNPQGSSLDRILASAEADLTAYWTEALPALGGTYSAPAYITFEEPIETGCGDADPGADGPFYCPTDRSVYLDLIAFEEEILPYGPFVVEFTVAHETGHHVQELLNLHACDVSACDGGYTNLQFELMADCFGGAWAKDAKGRGEVEDGDVSQAVVAIAAYFGDPPNTAANDPDAHGPGNLRSWWFLKGYYEGAETCLAVNQPTT